MYKLNQIGLLVAFLALSLFMWSCVDQDFDEPPVPILPDISANTTIADLKALHTIGEQDRLIEEDIIINGIVVANDRSGNFFKNIILQDETGGIELRLNATGLYNDFPVGREVFVWCKDLYIGDFNGVIQLNGSEGEGIEEVLIPRHVIAGEREEAVSPGIVAIDDLSDDLISTLVQLENVQFEDSDVNVTYADATDRLSVNLVIEDCNGSQIILRSSGFADFASELTPSGNGTLTAVYSVFGNTKQLYIRDLDDVIMNGDRCGGGGIPGTGDESQVTVGSLRAAFNNGAGSAPANSKIQGIVISDRTTNNFNSRNLILQDGSRGIVVRFTEDHNFDLGDRLEVVVSGAALSEFNGLLQLNNMETSAVMVLEKGQTISPRTATVGEVLDSLDVWESTLVRINGVQLSGNNVYGGALTVTDATGSVVLFTFNSATFAQQSIPSGEVELTAIVSRFNDPQLVIRDASDVSGGTVTVPVDTLLLRESFDRSEEDEDLALEGWRNVAIKGSRVWRGEAFSGEKFAQATAFQDSNAEMETWLISPALPADSARVLTFRSALAFHVHDGLAVLISDDFNGQDIGSATWKELNATLAGANDGRYEWVDSGEVDLSGYSGQIYIAFRYIGNKDSQTTTYRIDDIIVQ